MRGSLLVVALIVVGSSTAIGQPTKPPPGANEFFGAPASQPFDPKTVFAPPPPQVIPPPPPDDTVPAATDGGLIPKVLPKPWTGSGEIGITGASGNSDIFNFRTGFNFQRKTVANILTSDFLYQYTRSDGLTTTQQALWNARDEVLVPGGPWSLYAAGLFEYDELRAYRVRVGTYGGVGYAVIDQEKRVWKLRAGVGVVREIQPSNSEADRWVPEFALGTDVRYKLNDRSSFLGILDYYPRIDELTQFRVRTRLAYEYVLDPVSGVILRLGVQDRYDSAPGNAHTNDVTYFATLGWKF